MKTDDRKYWEAIAREMEEVVSNDFDEGIYNEAHIPDLEELASTCPFKDLSERLLSWAQSIHCRLESEVEYERSREEDNSNYIDRCFDVYDDSELS